MTNKPNAGGGNAPGNNESMTSPSSWPSWITGRTRARVARLERALTWSREPPEADDDDNPRTNGQTRRRNQANTAVLCWRRFGSAVDVSAAGDEFWTPAESLWL